MGTEAKNNLYDIPGLAIWCITPNGLSLARTISKQVKQAQIFVSEKISTKTPVEGLREAGFSNLAQTLESEFRNYSWHVFVFATGIAVRLIGRLLVSKVTDPAVVCVDDQGRFAVSLVSGHLGGANQLANQLSEMILCVPVITTATDTNHLPAIDMLAKQSDCYIETPENIKHVNMKILSGKSLSVYDPDGFLVGGLEACEVVAVGRRNAAAADVVCTHEGMSVSRETLLLRPRVLAVGVGCNRNTPVDVIREFVAEVFADENFSINSIGRFATSDVKKDEKGILELSSQENVPVEFYAREQMNAAEGVQNPSAMAKKHLGLNSVCEAAAILSSKNQQLLVTKKKNKDVTLAVAKIQ